MSRLLAPLIILLSLSAPLLAIDQDRDFTGKWILDEGRSDLSLQPAPSLTITVASAIRVSAPSGQWSYALNGEETKYKIGGETHNSKVKWEGAALLINTLVTGPRDYTIMDRWRLSADRSTLRINRQIMRGTAQQEGVVIYRKEGQRRAEPEPAVTESVPRQEPRILAKRPEPPPGPTFLVEAGTRIPLTLINSVDTKHSREGDRIYLQTMYPVSRNGRIVIPRGSSVAGTVTETKEAGRGRKKGEIYLRFDSLTLPNGTNRDFRSRLVGAEPSAGKVDRDEGKIMGETDPSAETRKVATGVGIGGTGGVLLGHTVGHTAAGGLIGAAAGAGAVLLGRGPDAVLRPGVMLEMVLDRDLVFRPEELY